MALYFCGEKHRILTKELDSSTSNQPDSLDLKDLVVTKNDTYTPNGFDGYSSVTVNVPTIITEEFNEEIIENGQYTYEAENGYAFNKIVLNVDISTEDIDCSHIIESGTCGDSVFYYLYDNGILCLNGTGSTSNYSSNTYNSPFTKLSSSIKYVVIENGVTNIGNCLFARCSSLTCIYIPNSVTSIGSSAFYNSGITNIIIPNSVTYLGESAFQFCGNLTSVVLPSSINTIRKATFGYCGNLNKIVIPNSVTNIISGSFSGAGITSIVLPNELTIINTRIFQDCNNLVSVTIPQTITKIESSAFDNTPLETIYYKGSQDDWNNISITSGYDEIFNADVYSEQTTLTKIQ